MLRALEASGATDVALILEVIHPFEADDDQALDDLRVSVDYWRRALADENRPPDALLRGRCRRLQRSGRA